MREDNGRNGRDGEKRETIEGNLSKQSRGETGTKQRSRVTLCIDQIQSAVLCEKRYFVQPLTKISVV